MLNHAMMTVEDGLSKEIAGFCEVAWLPSPSCVNENEQQRTAGEVERIHVSHESLDIPHTCCEETMNSYCDELSTPLNHQCDEATIQYGPSIVNLVTSPCHRR